MLAKFLKRLTATSLCGASMLAVVGVAKGQELGLLPISQAAPVASSTSLPSAPTNSAAPAKSAALPPSGSSEDLKSRIDRLERQNQDLLEALKKLQSSMPALPPGVGSPVNTATSSAESAVTKDQVQQMVTEYLKGVDDRKAAFDADRTPDSGYVVGKNLGLTGSWTNNQPWFETADKAFRVHFGGRTQFDGVWCTADADVQTAKGGHRQVQ